MIRGGVIEIYHFEHDLRPVETLKRKYYKTSTVEDRQEPVKNIAVVAGSSATPIKEEAANTAHNDISPQQVPTVATLPPPSSAPDTSNKNDTIARLKKLFRDQKAEREAREAAAHHTLDHHDHPEASTVATPPPPSSASDNFDGDNKFAHIEKLSLDQKTEQKARETAAHYTLDHHDYLEDCTMTTLPSDNFDRDDKFARIEKLFLDQKAEQEAREAAAHHTLNHHDPWHPEAPNPDVQPDGESVSTNERAMEMSDRREVATGEGYYQRTAIEDSAYGTASHGQSSGVKVVLPTDSNSVEQPIDDNGTEYSEISMTESRSLSYMEHLANDLYAEVSKVQCDPQSIQTLSRLLPELLQQFALRIGQEVPRKDGREVMYYVHKHRK